MKKLIPYCLLALTGVLSEAASDVPMIVQDGQPNAEIVISTEPPRTVKLAAEELRDTIKKISGAELSILTEPTGKYPVKLYVGKSKYTEDLGISSEGFKDDAYRIVSGKDYLAFVGDEAEQVIKEPFPKSAADAERALEDWKKLTGGRWAFVGGLQNRAYNKQVDISLRDGLGTLNGIYDFLRSLGVRWYFPGEFGEVVPSEKTIALPKLDKSVKPDFTQRAFGGRLYTFSKVDKEQALWLLRLGINAEDGMSARGHGLNNIIHDDFTRENHPDFYRMIDGKRSTTEPKDGQPCLSSKGLVQAVIDYGNIYFDVYNPHVLNITPTDGYISICQCELCKGRDTPERGFNGSMSDYVWSYANEVATALYKTHPGKEVNCNAYTTYMYPPLNIETMSPNLTVQIQQNRYKFGDAKARQWILDLRKAWLEKLPGKTPLTLHDNYSSSGQSPFPMFYPRLIAEDIRSLKGIGIGDYIEENSTNSQDPKPMVKLAVNHLNIYVTSRFWWDADQDVSAMLDEYYEKFYGPAAKEMKAFIDYSEANWSEMSKDVERIDKALALMAAARKAAGDDSIYAQRVALVDAYLAGLREVREKVAVGRTENPPVVVTDLGGTDGVVLLDGKLDEAFWKDAKIHKLHLSKTGEKPEFETSFQAVWKDDVLCLGVVCKDDDIKNLNIGTKNNEDTAIWEGDSVEILIETQVHSYYHIAVNPAGAIIDLDQERKNNTKWSSDAKLAVHVGEDYWSLEIQIPIADEMQAQDLPDQLVSGRKPTKDDPWHVNVGRVRPRVKDGEKSQEVSMFAVPGGKRAFLQPERFSPLFLDQK